MDNKLLNAILPMDSYNRSYNQGIDQGLMAFQFYKNIVSAAGYDPISLTSHSMGGGFAGLGA